MAGKGLYRVGKKSDYQTIQSAINALIEDQGNSEFTAEQRIIIQDSEVYTNFAIPEDSLTPTSVYRLTIQGKEGEYPVVDGSISEENSYGIQVGKSNPYITIQRLYVQGFYIGILVDSNSHYFELDQCFLKGNANTNLLVHLADYISVSNTLALNADYCIALNESKNFSLVNNTFFNDNSLRANASNYTACLFARLARDYGRGTADTGKAWIRNNIFVHLEGDSVILYENDLVNESVLSDYNNFYAPNGNFYKVLKDGTHTNPRNFLNKNHLISSFNTERHSIFADPIFFKPQFTNNIQDGYKLDFRLLLDSPVVGAGETYELDPLGMPIWINSILYLKDFENGSRLNPPTIGAIEADGVYNLISDSSSIPSFAKCNTNPYQPIIDSFQEDLWFPEVKEGHFFSNERKYYLYADKQAHRLSDLAITEFYLSVQISLDRPVKVYFKGEKVPDENIDIVSNKLILKHKGLDIQDKSEEIIFEGFYPRWLDSKYSYVEFKQVLRIGSGRTRYFLEEPYYLLNGSPIVITDDKASLNDRENLSYNKFQVDNAEDFQKPEITFGLNSNVISNPQFDYIEEGIPLHWNISGSVSGLSVFNNVRPVKGDYFCYLTGDSHVSSFVKLQDFTGDKPNYFWTWYSQANDDYSWEIRGYDSNGRVYSLQEGVANSTKDWERFECPIGVFNEYLSGYYEPGTNSFDYVEISSDITELELKLKTSKDLYLDCIQFEKGDAPRVYHRIPKLNDLTVEYEGSASGFYRVQDFSLSPISNHNNNGFFSIQNIKAKLLDKNAPEDATTLSEYRWQNGRLNILPWSRISGIDKYFFQSILDEKLSQGQFEKEPLFDVPEVETINLYPTTLQALQDSQGEYFYIELFDQYDNPASFENCKVTVFDPAGEYPGILTSKKYSIPTARSVSLSGECDSAGKLYLHWEPPTSSDTIYAGSLPTGSQNNYINTKYRVSLINYGNIKVFSQSNEEMNSFSSVITTGTFPISKGDKFDYIELPYYPKTESVYVNYQGTQWKESEFYVPLENEYQVLYNQKTIRIPKGLQGFAEVAYQKALTWTQPEYGRRIFFDTELLNSASGNVTIYYDAEIFLSAEADNGIVSEFSMIAQSPK